MGLPKPKNYSFAQKWMKHPMLCTMRNGVARTRSQVPRQVTSVFKHPTLLETLLKDLKANPKRPVGSYQKHPMLCTIRKGLGYEKAVQAARDFLELGRRLDL